MTLDSKPSYSAKPPASQQFSSPKYPSIRTTIRHSPTGSLSTCLHRLDCEAALLKRLADQTTHHQPGNWMQETHDHEYRGIGIMLDHPSRQSRKQGCADAAAERDDSRHGTDNPLRIHVIGHRHQIRFPSHVRETDQ